MSTQLHQLLINAKRDVAQKQSTAQQLQSEFDMSIHQKATIFNKINFQTCISIEESCRGELLSLENEKFAVISFLQKYRLCKFKFPDDDDGRTTATKTSRPSSSSRSPQKQSSKKEKKSKKGKTSLWGNHNKSNSKGKIMSSENSGADSDGSGETNDYDDDDEITTQKTEQENRLNELIEEMYGSSVCTSAVSPQEFLSPRKARELQNAANQQLPQISAEDMKMITESLPKDSPLRETLFPQQNENGESTNSPLFSAISAFFSKNTDSNNTNNNANNNSSITTNNDTNSKNNNNNNAAPMMSRTTASPMSSSTNINISYDEGILNSQAIQKQFREQNPNQLGDLLLDPYHPMWYTGKCLSAAIRTYYSKQVIPEKVQISSSHDEQNVAAMASSAMHTAVSTATTVVDTGVSLFGALIQKTAEFVNLSDSSSKKNNNSNNHNHKEKGLFGGLFGGSSKGSEKDDHKTNNTNQYYVVEPLWFHMENNDIVVHTVQPSLFLPFPSFNEHNHDDKLRLLYREMARRSAAERARREGTSAAVPVVMNNNNNNNIRHHHNSSNSNSNHGGGVNIGASSHHQNNKGSNNFSANELNSFIRSQPRHIRADEFRIAFFATDTFRQIHKALDFDANELVEHAIFDLAHPWRTAHSPGKSDSTFFFFGHFVAKSMKEHEFKYFFEKFLPKYVEHVKINKFTLLPHFLGMVSVADLSRGTTSPQILRLVIMNNVFPTKRVIQRMYDLKGSTVNRDGLSGDITKTSFGAVLLKDNDLPQKLLLVGPVRSRLLTLQLRCDTDFLNSLAILDYSLLVGVRSDHVKIGANGQLLPANYHSPSTSPIFVDGNINNNNDDDDDNDNNMRPLRRQPSSLKESSEIHDGSCFRSWDGGMPSLPIFDNPNDMTSARIDTFYIGLIDVLQNFSAAKRFEATTKGLFYSGQASVVPPDEFAKRICESIEKIVD